MKRLLKRLSHGFWLWVGERIVIHKAQEEFDKAKDRIVEDLTDDGFLDRAMEGTAAVIDEEGKFYPLDTSEGKEVEARIIKGYDKPNETR